MGVLCLADIKCLSSPELPAAIQGRERSNINHHSVDTVLETTIVYNQGKDVLAYMQCMELKCTVMHYCRCILALSIVLYIHASNPQLHIYGLSKENVYVHVWQVQEASQYEQNSQFLHRRSTLGVHGQRCMFSLSTQCDINILHGHSNPIP